MGEGSGVLEGNLFAEQSKPTAKSIQYSAAQRAFESATATTARTETVQVTEELLDRRRNSFSPNTAERGPGSRNFPESQSSRCDGRREALQR